MTDDAPDPGSDATDQPDTDQPDNQDAPEGDSEDEWSPPSREAYERLLRTANARKRERDQARAEARELKGKDKDAGPDPVAQANGRLVRSEAKGLLAARGVTDRDDQASLLDVLRLDDIEVDDRGDVDVDGIDERIDRLWKIISGAAGPNGRRAPRTDTRDRGRNDPGKTRDQQRIERILGRRT